MTSNPTASSAFEAALEKSCTDFANANGARKSIAGFYEGARWSRDYTTRDVLKNHPVMRAMVKYFEQLEFLELGTKFESSDRLAVNELLNSYRKATAEKEG